jgi:sentrin-specific protease 1
MKRIFENAKATLNSPERPPYNSPEDPRKVLDRMKDAAIEARLRGIPNNLPTKEEEQVDAILRKRGVVAKFAREQVSDADVARLRPGQWLNDEVVNFYGAMILARSEDNKENAQVVSKGSRNGSLDVHYFSTFFWAKLIREGYERGRLAKWTKKASSQKIWDCNDVDTFLDQHLLERCYPHSS